MEKEPAPGAAESPIDNTPQASSDVKEAFTDGDNEVPVQVPMPDSWMYRSRRIAGFTFPHYASPVVQLTMVSFVCFLCPGMFNALSGLGGAGKINNSLGDDMVSCSSLSSSFQIELEANASGIEYCYE